MPPIIPPPPTIFSHYIATAILYRLDISQHAPARATTAYFFDVVARQPPQSRWHAAWRLFTAVLFSRHIRQAHRIGVGLYAANGVEIARIARCRHATRIDTDDISTAYFIIPPPISALLDCTINCCRHNYRVGVRRSSADAVAILARLLLQNRERAPLPIPPTHTCH